MPVRGICTTSTTDSSNNIRVVGETGKSSIMTLILRNRLELFGNSGIYRFAPFGHWPLSSTRLESKEEPAMAANSRHVSINTLFVPLCGI